MWIDDVTVSFAEFCRRMRDIFDTQAMRAATEKMRAAIAEIVDALRIAKDERISAERHRRERRTWPRAATWVPIAAPAKRVAWDVSMRAFAGR